MSKELSRTLEQLLDGRSISETGFTARFGAGMDVYFNAHFGLSVGLAYVLPTGNVDDVPFLVVDARACEFRRASRVD